MNCSVEVAAVEVGGGGGGGPVRVKITALAVTGARLHGHLLEIAGAGVKGDIDVAGMAGRRDRDAEGALRSASP